MPATPDDLQWSLSYDRASVERFLAEIEVERAALQADIERAVRARQAAEHATAQREADAAAELGARAVAAWSELDRIEAEHREMVVTIREAAERESARVLAAAHREVAAMRESTATLAALVHPVDSIADDDLVETDDAEDAEDGDPLTVDHGEARDHADAG